MSRSRKAQHMMIAAINLGYKRRISPNIGQRRVGYWQIVKGDMPEITPDSRLGQGEDRDQPYLTIFQWRIREATLA